jgi:energy-coupling factor transport system permease protein
MTVLINLFLTPGTTAVAIGKLTITYEGLAAALGMMIRLILLIMGSSIVTLTTTPNNLTDGLEKGLGFLKVFKVPVGDVAMMMSIALRFIPILLEETDRIMKAQLARGADFESGNLVKKAKSLVPVLVPLFVSAFRRAGDLAMAMEARCYRGGDGRTKMKPLVYKKRDAFAYLILFSFVGISIFLGRWHVISDFFNSLYVNYILK